MKNILSKIRSVKLCLMAHPHNEPGSEFADRISDLEELEEDLSSLVVSVKERLPSVEHGSFLVYSPTSFPKNSRWLVAEYYEDVKGFYSEASENFLEDVTHWCELPNEPK